MLPSGCFERAEISLEIERGKHSRVVVMTHAAFRLY
jgi:hypothetical protein